MEERVPVTWLLRKQLMAYTQRVEGMDEASALARWQEDSQVSKSGMGDDLAVAVI